MANSTDTAKFNQLVRKVRWYVTLRWFYLFGLSLPGLMSLYLNQGNSPTFKRSLGIALIGFAYNGVFYFLARRKNRSLRYFTVLGWVQVLSDIILTSFLIISGGGVESRAIIVYAIGIIISGAMFGPWATYITAFLSILFYGTVVVLDWMGVIRIGDIAAPQLHGDTGYTITTLAFYSTSLMVVGAVSNFVTKLIKEQENLALDDAKSLDEAQHLARLGSWILNIRTNHIAWSDELYRIYGMEPQHTEITYASFLKRVHPHDRKRLDAIIQQACKDFRPINFEHRIVLPDESIRTLYAMGRVNIDSSGHAVSIQGTGQDVTEASETEHSLQNSLKEMEKLNRITINRELKMIELKKELNSFKKARD